MATMPGREGDAPSSSRRTVGVYQIPIDQDGVALALLAAGDRRGAAAEVIRIHGARIREYLRAALLDEDAGGKAVRAPALRKRFERLKDRIVRLARELGVFE